MCWLTTKKTITASGFSFNSTQHHRRGSLMYNRGTQQDFWTTLHQIAACTIMASEKLPVQCPLEDNKKAVQPAKSRIVSYCQSLLHKVIFTLPPSHWAINSLLLRQVNGWPEPLPHSIHYTVSAILSADMLTCIADVWYTLRTIKRQYTCTQWHYDEQETPYSYVSSFTA